MTIGRRLLAAAGAIGITVAAGLAGAGTANAADTCGAGQLCVWIAQPLGGTHVVVVSPPARPQCASLGFGPTVSAVRAVNRTSSAVVFFERATWAAPNAPALCAGRSTTLAAGASATGFPFIVHGVAR